MNYGAGSSITGDILSAYAGQVDIQAQDGSDAGISVKGNILAGNNGVLNIDLGKGGYLEGRADDYGDAGLGTVGEDIDQGHATHEFFNPAFSSTIFKGGEVNLTMGEGSRWNVTGQRSDAFRSMNTMMELGYDTRVNDREDGEHRQGVVFDYMRGTADYIT